MVIDMLKIGTPVYNPYASEIGYIAKIEQSRLAGFVIGANGMEQCRAQYTIVYPDKNSCDSTPDTIAAPWVTEAARMQIEPILNAGELLAKAEAARADKRAAQQLEREAAEAARAAYEREIAPRIPSWAKAVIVGELIQDKSDSMSDYHNGITLRRVILGFSKHTRDLFPELRAAAGNCPETADLVSAPDSAEHREKYSMGGGYYLKHGWRYSDGWKISKQALGDNRARSIPSGDWFIDAPSKPPAESEGSISAPMSGGWNVSKHLHTKHGFDFWICNNETRFAREVFDALLAKARALGGWYSRPWHGTPGGFAFKPEASALAFIGGEHSPDAMPGDSAPSVAPSVAAMSEAMGDKLRALAEGLEGDIRGRYADRRENTPKQQRQAAEARLEGSRLERTRDGLRALASLHDAGDVPPELRAVRSKKAAYDLAAEKITRNGGYYDAGCPTGEPAHNTPAAIAFWNLLKPDASKAEAEKLRQKIAGLKFASIPGYFPTPPDIVARMLEHAGNLDGLTIIEPSAGDGAILDAIRAEYPSARLMACERNHTLCTILEAKGHLVDASDCTEWKPPFQCDRVLMNPPFENGQDAAHIRLAHSWLRDGGRLVAIMSPGPFFRNDLKSLEFREWFERMGGEKFDLPAGAFKASGTSVATVLVVIGKD